VNPLASAAMATAVDIAHHASNEVPVILWPTDWPPPELVAWTLACMMAETLPANDAGRPESAAEPLAPWQQRLKA